MICTGINAEKAESAGMGKIDPQYFNNINDQMIYLDLISLLCIDQYSQGIESIQNEITQKLFGPELNGIIGMGSESADENHKGEAFLTFITGKGGKSYV